MVISYLSIKYDMAQLLLLLVHLNATACSVEVLFLTAHSDCNTLLYHDDHALTPILLTLTRPIYILLQCFKVNS